MIDFLKAIIRPSYWITHQHPVPEAWQTGLLIFFGALIVIGLLATVLAFIKKFPKPFRTFFGRLAPWGWVMGACGLVLLFFSIERVSFISARLFYLLWLGATLWWLYYIVRYAIVDIPRLMEMKKEKAEAEKYLPKRKK